MKTNLDESTIVVNEAVVDVEIEELESIAAPTGIVIQGPVPGGVFKNHNETVVRDENPGLEEIEELEPVAPGVATSPGPIRNHNETIVSDGGLAA